MKKIFLVAIIYLLVSSCQNNSKEQGYCVLIPKENIKSLIDSFTLINNYSDVYELYINKEDPHCYSLLLYAGSESLTLKENIHNNQKPICYVISNKKRIMIFSGIEHYFSNIVECSENYEYKPEKERSIWVIRDSLGVLRVDKSEYAYPFMPVPNQTDIDQLLPPSVN